MCESSVKEIAGTSVNDMEGNIMIMFHDIKMCLFMFFEFIVFMIMCFWSMETLFI